MKEVILRQILLQKGYTREGERGLSAVATPWETRLFNELCNLPQTLIIYKKNHLCIFVMGCRAQHQLKTKKDLSVHKNIWFVLNNGAVPDN